MVQAPRKTVLDKMDPICFYIPRWLLEFLFCPVHDYLKSHSFSWNLYPQNGAKTKASLFSRIPRRPRSNMLISMEVKRSTPQQWGQERSSGQDTQVEHKCSCHGRVWGTRVFPGPGHERICPPAGLPWRGHKPQPETMETETILLRLFPLCRLVSVPWSFAAFLELSATVLLWLFLLMNCIIF